jgi:hypothetical protein
MLKKLLNFLPLASTFSTYHFSRYSFLHVKKPLAGIPFSHKEELWVIMIAVLVIFLPY